MMLSTGGSIWLTENNRDTRMVRKLDNGNYLVCQEGEGRVREYDSNGKIVWEYAVELGDRPRSDGHGPEGHAHVPEGRQRPYVGR